MKQIIKLFTLRWFLAKKEYYFTYLFTLFNIVVSSCSDTTIVKSRSDGHAITIKPYRDSDLKSWSIITNGKQIEKVANADVAFLAIRNWGRDNWHIMIDWNGNIMHVYQPYSHIDYSKSNLDSSIVIHSLYARDFFEIYYNLSTDSAFLKVEGPP